MIDGFILALREGLEAALVIGIILVQLVEIQKKELTRVVILGVLVGFFACILGGGLLFFLLHGQEYSQNPIFEGLILLFSAAFIAYLPYWLHRNSSTTAIESKITQSTSAIVLFLLSFFTVFREGSELAVFVLVKVKNNAGNIALGVALGILVAILVAFLVFKLSIRLHFGLLFTILSLFLIYIGGDLFAHSLDKLFSASGTIQSVGMWLFIVGSVLLLFRKQITRLLGGKN